MRTDSGRIKRENMIKAIEEEFDEPLADIVMGMRKQRCSWETIAGSLGVCVSTLISWRKRFGFGSIDPKSIITEDWEKDKYQDRIARERGYRNFEDLYADMRLHKKMLVSDIEQFMGVGHNSIWKWIPDSMKENMYIHTPKRIESRRKNLEKAREEKRKKYKTLWTDGL